MDKDVQSIPYIVYESMATKTDVIIKRLIIALIVSIILLFACNAGWLVAWMQYDYADVQTIEAQQDGEGTNLIGGGDISLGTDGAYYIGKNAN